MTSSITSTQASLYEMPLSECRLVICYNINKLTYLLTKETTARSDSEKKIATVRTYSQRVSDGWSLIFGITAKIT